MLSQILSKVERSVWSGRLAGGEAGVPTACLINGVKDSNSQ